MKRSGFTLVEILVVIGILTVLSAILFPVFARVRENGRRAACQSNLKQIALGFMQYTQDYDGTFPPAGGPPRGLLDHPLVRIGPYTKSEQIFQCPSDSTKITDDSAMSIPALTTSNWVVCSYLVTSSKAEPDAVAQWGIIDEKGVPLADVKLPSETITISEGMMTPSLAGWFISSIGQSGAIPQSKGSEAASKFVTRRHSMGANYAFADGHVKWFKRAESDLDPYSWDDQTGANATLHGVRNYYFWRSGVNGK